MPDHVAESASPLQPEPWWGGRRAWQEQVDEMVLRGLVAGRTTTVEVEGRRLPWWRQRRRLRRKYGVVATRIGDRRWSLARSLPSS